MDVAVGAYSQEVSTELAPSIHCLCTPLKNIVTKRIKTRKQHLQIHIAGKLKPYMLTVG